MRGYGFPPVRIGVERAAAQRGPQLAIVAANAAAYADLLALVELHAARAEARGERLCVTLAGTAFARVGRLAGDRRDAPKPRKRLVGDTPVVFAESLDVDDCVKMLAAAAR
jgi:hypothetical protein